MIRLKLPLAIVAGSALVAALVGFTTASKSHASSDASAAAATSAATSVSKATASTGTDLQNAFVSVFKNVSPSVVQIETASDLGSGIVFDSKGDIVTNDHVVGTAKTFTVTTASGKQLKGTLVGTFAGDDIAVIKVSGGNLKPATFADSSKLEVGDLAMALGNPLGLQSSFTEGIVSALNRDESEGNGFTLARAIQTSAAINPGNSGGALVDINGDVIGIPTLAATDAQEGGAAAGIGFAIPSNDVKNYAQQIIDHGKVVSSNRAYIGVAVADTGQENGVYISGVTAGTPGAKAGLKTGELITAVNGKATADSSALGTVLAGLKPGQTVTVKVTLQSGGSSTVKVTLGEYPGSTS